MNEQDKKILAELVRNYPIHDFMNALQETIENQVDELVDMNEGNPFPMTKEMTRVAYHLSIFARD